MSREVARCAMKRQFAKWRMLSVMSSKSGLMWVVMKLVSRFHSHHGHMWHCWDIVHVDLVNIADQGLSVQLEGFSHCL